jgi:hypothetical protein
MKMAMTMNKRISMGIMVLVLTIIAAYTFEYTYKDAGVKSGTIIGITNNDQPAAFMGGDVLKKLPGGTKVNSQEGPSLTSVLVAAGISNFSKVEITGIRKGVPYVVTKAEISNDFIFYYTDHNTVNLAKKDNYQNVLVEDVSSINTLS